MVDIVEGSHEDRKIEQGLDEMVKMAEEIFEDCEVSGSLLGITMMPKDNHLPFVANILPSIRTLHVYDSEYFDKTLELGKRIEAKYLINFKLFTYY